MEDTEETLIYSLYLASTFVLETFELDNSNTKKLLEGKRGELIRWKDILVRLLNHVAVFSSLQFQRDNLMFYLTWLSFTLLDRRLLESQGCLHLMT